MRKYAIITGGSRGIGRAICEKLAQDTDYHLLIAYQSNESSPNSRDSINVSFFQNS